MLNWNDLRYFLAIARNGSIGTAAKALGVNKSTVQRRLRALEAALDCSLAERKPGGYQLTTKGQRLLENARQVESSVGTLHRQVATFEPGITGHVRLTSHVTVGQRIIKSGFLDRFHLDHPGITVELIMEQRALDLSKGEADIAIRGGDLGNSALVGKKIAEVPWGIYASHSFLERYGQPSTPADIENFSVVELVDEIADLPAARWMKLNAPKAKSAARCSNVPKRTSCDQGRRRHRTAAGCLRGRRQGPCLCPWSSTRTELSDVSSLPQRFADGTAAPEVEPVISRLSCDGTGTPASMDDWSFPTKRPISA